MKKVVSFVYFFFFTSLFCSVTAFAYIDPSAMTYMVQLIAGIAIAAGAGASYYFRRFKRRFSNRSRDKGRAVQYCGEDDDDDTGYGDYEMDAPAQPQQIPSASFQAEEAQPSFQPAYAYAGEPAAAPVDPFDEAGGEGGLAAENRELRRLLAEERQKVEELKRALHICTAPKR